MEIVAAIGIGVVFVLGMSLVPEPFRQQFNAVFVGGAGAAYLNGGVGVFGMAELAFATGVALLATMGLRSYPFIGAAWMAHVAWDVAHHAVGEPLLQFDPSSSLGCAVCDTVIALWFFAGAPSPFQRKKKVRPAS